MRIALLAACAPAQEWTYCLQLAGALREAGATVDVWLAGRGGELPGDPDVRRLEVPCRRGDSAADVRRRSVGVLADAFTPRRDDFDVRHSQDGLALVAAGGGVRTVHRIPNPADPELAALGAHGLRLAVGHLCRSRAVARELADRFDIAPVVLPPALDVGVAARAAGDDGRAARRRWRRRLGHYVLAVGRDPGTPANDPRAGRAPASRSRTVVLADGLLLGADGVALAAPAPAEIPVLVAAADAMVVPGSDGAGLEALTAELVLCALAAGRPVVALADPELAGLVGTAVQFAGSRAELDDVLTRVQVGPDPDRLDRGLAIARRHPWSAVADLHLRYYRSVLARRGRRVPSAAARG